jgi:hypothetical protein
MSIRNALKVSLLALTLMVPISSHALAIDPVTVATTAAAVVGAVDSFFSNKATKDWQKEVGGKLDTLIAQNTEILANIKQLGIEIPEMLETQYRKELSIQGQALAQQFDNRMHSSQRTDRKKLVSEISEEVEFLSYQMLDVGPATFQSAYAAGILNIASYEEIEIKKARRNSYLKTAIGKFESWDTDSEGNILFALNLAKKDFEQKLTAFNALGGGRKKIATHVSKYFVPKTPDSPRELLHCSDDVFATIEVNDSDFTFSVSPTDMSECVRGAPYDGIRAAYRESFQNKLKAASIAVIAAKERFETLTKLRELLLNMTKSLRELVLN